MGLTPEQAIEQERPVLASSDGARTKVRKIKAIVDQVPVLTPAPDPTPTPTPSPIPTLWRRYASYEAASDFVLNSNSEPWLDGHWRTSEPYRVTRTDEKGGAVGSHSVKIDTTPGPATDGCSCPRMKFQDGFSLGEGDEIWFGGSWFLTDNRIMDSRLVNLGHYVSEGSIENSLVTIEVNEAGALTCVGRNRVKPFIYGAVIEVAKPPVGRWFNADVHAVLSELDGKALTELYVDGAKVGSSTKWNLWRGNPLTFYMAGLPYLDERNAGTIVYFDAPRLT